MADRVSIKCPGCSAKLNLPDRSKLGKKIKCPKCSEVFVAEDPDNATAEFDRDTTPAKSSGSRKRPAAGARKAAPSNGKSSSGGGANVPLIAGGSVAAIMLIGAGLYFAGVFGGGNPPPVAPPVVNVPPAVVPEAVAPPQVAPPVVVSPAEKILALRWMPTETELLVHAKVADIWQAPLLKGLIDTPQAAEGIKEMQKATGLSPADIESFTVGFADMQGLQSMAASRAMGMPGPPAVPKLMVVVRTKKPVSLDEILKTNADLRSAEYNGKKYFESTKPQEPAGWVAEPTTVVIAEPAELKAAMDRGETVTPRKEMSLMDAAPHVVVVFAPKDPKSLSQGIDTSAVPGAPAEAQELVNAMKESFAAFGLGLNIRGGFDLQTAMLFNSDDGAKKVKAGIDKGIAEGRTQFEQFKATAQPLLAELGDMLLSNLKVDEKSQVVKISTSIPDTAQEKLTQLPPLLMVMAMSSGLAGGGLAGFGPGNDPNMTPETSPGGVPGSTPNNPNAVPGNLLPGGIGGDLKKPGETDPVDPETADGLPDGVTLSVRTAWNDFPTFTADGKQSHPIQIMLDLKGDGISGICGYGQITAKTISLSEGGALKMSKSQSFGLPDPTKAILPFDANDTFNLDHPEGSLRLAFPVEPPKDGVSAIASLEGAFKFLTSDETEDITIEDAAKKALKPLTDPALKAAGVKLLYTKPTNIAGETLTLSCGKGFFLGKAGASNPGDPNSNGLTMYFNPEIEKNQFVQKLHPFDQSGKFPENLQISFKLFRGVKEHTVSFKFTDVPLPSPDSKPKPGIPGLPSGN